MAIPLPSANEGSGFVIPNSIGGRIMANKKFWPGMLITALVFGTVIIGCDTGTNSGSAAITYTVEANGKAETETSTELRFTFSSAVSGLVVENIEIFGNGLYLGSAEKNASVKGGALTGSGTSWTLNINKVTEGKIRVQITKPGIEGGRKTVAIYKDNATGESPDQAITLAEGVWVDGHASKSEPKWYKFKAEKGTDYRAQWKHRDINVQGETDMVTVKVTAYKSDHTTIIISSNIGEKPGLEGLLISGGSEYVYLKVEVIDSKYFGGRFEIKFLDMANMGPHDVIQILTAGAMPNRSVLISWQAYPMESSDNLESSEYRVYRSETKNGSYKLIDSVPGPSTPGSHDYQNYTDTKLGAGKTYWYKVVGYNSKGEGEMSEPKESQEVKDEEAGIELTVGGVETEGEFKKLTQVEWYKFTAESGKTYEVEWKDAGESSLSMVLQISAFKSDKTLIDDYYDGGSISGVNGTVYLKVQLNSYWYDRTGGYCGPYTIKVSKK